VISNFDISLMSFNRACCFILFCLLSALALPAGAAVVNATWATTTDIPVTASNYTATGNTVNFTLNFAPPTGTNLTVVNNTGLPFVSGTFDNLAQGQAVLLSYNGVTYNYVAHYYGGSGNDLVLVWANNRAFAWGNNNYGQVGDGTNTLRYMMVPVMATGVLAGKTIVALAQGDYHSLALCSDGTVAAWGDNFVGQLGNNTTTNSNVPVLVNTASGVSALFDKTVVAVSAGFGYSMALCSDGTVATWGYNNYYALGNNGANSSSVPVMVNAASGVSWLYGKTVVAIEAGYTHALALCSDGTVAAWGDNTYGQLGNNGAGSSKVPVAVNSTSGISALSGKTVVKLAAGEYHSMALCSDGTLVTWGQNTLGQLGDGSTTQRNVPVAVNTANGSSALYAKSVVSIASGYYHCMALCSDGAVATWGWNNYGPLGNNTTAQSTLPVAVNTDSGVSALFGKTVVAIAASYYNSRVLCADGSLASWGYNLLGQLGNNGTANSSVPVAVNASAISAGETFVNPANSNNTAQTMILVAEPPPGVTTQAATAIAGSSAVLHGMVSGFNNSVNVTFDYGATADYGTSIAATPSTVAGNLPVAVAASLTGLLPLRTYHFRVNDGVHLGGDLTFTTPNNDASLARLTTSVGSLNPRFDSGTPNYTVSVAATTVSMAITPNLSDDHATVAVNGVSVSSGSVNTLNLVYGKNSILVQVTAQDGVMRQAYTIDVNRAIPTPIVATYTLGNEVPLTVNQCAATGGTVNFTLNFAPTPGTNLMVVNNLGLPFINGNFDNLEQGQRVTLSYNGVSYDFVANYYGGTGNDLVLMWANTRIFEWGSNFNYQLGDNTRVPRMFPGAGMPAGALSGKTVMSLANAQGYSMALCSDNTLVLWGQGPGGAGIETNTTPTAVNTQDPLSVLYGKRLIAIAAGGGHCLVLCSDGTLAAWGWNSSGQIGDGSYTDRAAPVVVNAASGVSALYGKTVVAITAGYDFSMALCSDGTVTTWGNNFAGKLGDNTTTTRTVPVQVNTSASVSALFNKNVVAISAGSVHALALCDDGTVVAWGFSSYLGGDSNDSSVPLAVNTLNGTSSLYGKAVVSIAAGSTHSLALCSDGTLSAWGANSYGQLGDATTTSHALPVQVNAAIGTSALYGRSVLSIKAGYQYSVALCSDGTALAWGSNDSGQIGDGTTTSRNAPMAVSNSTLAGSESFTALSSGFNANHTLALVADPSSIPTTLAASSITGTGATLNGMVNASNGGAIVSFDFGSTTAYGTTIPGTPAMVTGSGDVSVNTAVSGLTPGTTYHFRVKGGATQGTDVTFTTLKNNASLSSLLTSSGTLSPAFSSDTTSYLATVSSDTTSIVFIPVVADSDAKVVVNTVAVASGTVGDPINLGYGSNSGFSVTVTAQDGVTTKTYSIVNINRPPPELLTAIYFSGSDVPLTTNGCTATGSSVNFALNYAPLPGARLMVVNNTGPGFFAGTFSNLAQGQTVMLTYNGITYSFVADYYGGTGNDLVLQWVGNRAFSWGLNSSGQLGDGTITQRSLPVPVTASGVLSGKTILSIAAGTSHCLALCSDGTLAAWGDNSVGQIGDGTGTQRKVPVAVNTASGSSLFGKQVVAIAVGSGHSMALCSDGTVSTWGWNANGQLGNNGTVSSSMAVAVNTTVAGSSLSALYGKTVVAIAAGQYHSMALCSDGTVAAWGSGSSGQLGTNSTASALIPVAVKVTSGVSALFGKTVSSIAAGGSHSFALCSDGTLAAWGSNSNGQLGDTTTTRRNAPVAVSMAAGVSALAGRSVMAVTGGLTHSLALCSDGAVVTWGGNASGQLGDTTLIDKYAPVAVSVTAGSSALAGKTVRGITAGSSSSFAQAADGTLVSWGADASGQLGDNSSTNESAPVAVNSSPLAAGEAFSGVFGGPNASHTLALVGSPPVPVATTLAATVVAGTSATLNGTVNARNNSSTVTFDYGTTTAYGTTVSAVPATVTGSSSAAVGMVLSGLTEGTTYHFRINGVNAAGGSNGDDLTFNTLSLLQNWRQQSFGTTANSGTTADAADYDKDGIPNLIEWACNLNPAGRSVLPMAVTTNGANFEYAYSRSTAAVAAGTGFMVEWSDTLAAGSWSSSGVAQTVLSDDGTTQQVKAVIPINAANAKFVHLSVSAPP
jgi:alpha-tubulin suppressor-like RCC1 family protein